MHITFARPSAELEIEIWGYVDESPVPGSWKDRMLALLAVCEQIDHPDSDIMIMKIKASSERAIVYTAPSLE